MQGKGENLPIYPTKRKGKKKKEKKTVTKKIIVEERNEKCSKKTKGKRSDEIWGGAATQERSISG